MQWRFVLLGLVYGIVAVQVLYFVFRPNGLMGFGLFMDGHTVLGAARSWLAGDGFYPASQLAGPHPVGIREILYPPPLLLLLVPFSFAPVIVWVLVPLGILVHMIRWWGPSYWALVAIGLCLWVPQTFGAYLFANPTIWFAAFVALATRWPAFGPLVLIKPTLAPFALVGIRHRSWWVTVTLLVAFTLGTLPLLFDWLAVMRNVGAAPGGWTYSVPVMPLLLIPLIAKWGTTRPGPTLVAPQRSKTLAPAYGGRFIRSPSSELS